MTNKQIATTRIIFANGAINGICVANQTINPQMIATISNCKSIAITPYPVTVSPARIVR